MADREGSVEGSNRFVTLADGVWVGERPFTFGGFLEFGNRMTVIRLPDGALWVHSPNALDDAAKAFFAREGEPRYFVAPNVFHHLFLEEWKKAYPRALFFAAPGLESKRRDFPWDGILSARGEDEPWSPAVVQHLFQGAPKLGEVVFFHPPSRVMIVTDLVMNFDDAWTKRPLNALVLRIYGAWGAPTVTRFARSFMKDRAAARASVEALAALDPATIVVSHGHVVRNASGALVRGLFSFLGA